MFNVVVFFLQPNCDVNSSDNSGCAPLHLAISEGNTYLIEQLVGYGADLNMKEQSGCTPLNILVFLEMSGVHVTVTFQPISNKTPRLLQVLNLISRIHTKCVCKLPVACIIVEWVTSHLRGDRSLLYLSSTSANQNGSLLLCRSNLVFSVYFKSIFRLLLCKVIAITLSMFYSIHRLLIITFKKCVPPSPTIE